MARISVMPPPRGIRRYKLITAAEVFLDALATSGASHKTIKSYRAALKSFIEFIGADVVVERLGEEAYVNWLSYLRKRVPRLSKSTLHYYSVFVRRFLQWLNVVDDVPTVPGDSGSYSLALSWDQIEALYSVATSLRDLAIVSLLAESGLRAGELLSMTWRDIDLVKGIARVKGKYGKERFVLLGPVSREALARLYEELRPRPYERVFPISYQALYKKMKTLARRAGIDPKMVRPHVLRHTFATEALRRGMSLPALQRLLGHSDIKVTQRYLHLVTEDIEREYARVFLEGNRWRETSFPPYVGYNTTRRARILD